MNLPYLDPRVLSFAEAVDALEAALRDGLDVEADPPRSAAGPLLLMPSTAGGGLGVKLVTVGSREPRVQGVYVLFDAETLAPAALLDGIGMTDLRTAAVSALAVRHLARRRERLVVFGTGPQARAHVAALEAAHVRVVGRDPERTAAFAESVGAEVAGPGAVADADVVVCATTARSPVFDGELVPEHATVVAIGSHEPDAREVDSQLVERASIVVVESRGSALREAGDVIMAGLGADDLVDIGELVRGEVEPGPGPRLFKGTGMAWEDLVIARQVLARH